jgi:hypothetical protein
MIESKYMNQVIEGLSTGGSKGWSIISHAAAEWKKRGDNRGWAAGQVAVMLDCDVADFLDWLSIHLEKQRGPNLEAAVDEISALMGERGKLFIRELARRMP